MSKAPMTGADDYRCFLLDPGLDDDAFVTGLGVVPDRATLRPAGVFERLDGLLGVFTVLDAVDLRERGRVEEWGSAGG